MAECRVDAGAQCAFLRDTLKFLTTGTGSEHRCGCYCQHEMGDLPRALGHMSDPGFAVEAAA
jgi:hypothetical protein